MDELISNYVELIKRKEDHGGGESSYYPPLEIFLKDFAKKILKKDIVVIVEHRHSFGVPDFTIFSTKHE